MQKGYWVSCYREIYGQQIKRVCRTRKVVVESEGGRFLVRGPSIYASGSGLLERTVGVG